MAKCLGKNGERESGLWLSWIQPFSSCKVERQHEKERERERERRERAREERESRTCGRGELFLGLTPTHTHTCGSARTLLVACCAHVCVCVCACVCVSMLVWILGGLCAVETAQGTLCVAAIQPRRHTKPRSGSVCGE